MTFQSDGSVKFISYINNLHPSKYPEIYRAIEDFVSSVAISMWEQCLTTVTGEQGEKAGAGRTRSRLTVPDDLSDDNEKLWEPETLDNAESGGDVGSGDIDSDEYEEIDYSTRTPIEVEPNPFNELDYTPTSRLAAEFKDSGLQVIVKMASIELTPEKPTFEAGNWHVEGQMNEQICATALYYVDSENITPSSLSFRVRTPTEEWESYYAVGQDAYHWLEKVYGVNLGGGSGDPCLQRYGSVQTPQDRVLAFPNVFQHTVSPFQLLDPSKPGHRRFLAVWLVDPRCRIISTANVPPQQQNWWVESALGSSKIARQRSSAKLPAELVRLLQEKLVLDETDVDKLSEGRLPPELLEKVRQNFNVDLMSESTAKEHREELMKVRTVFQEDARKDWNDVRYSFCEH